MSLISGTSHYHFQNCNSELLSLYVEIFLNSLKFFQHLKNVEKLKEEKSNHIPVSQN